MILQNKSVPDYVDLVIDKLVKLTVHSYISELKEELPLNTAIILAENYSFLVKDELSSMHTSPFIYYTEEHMLKQLSYCIISDDNNHNVVR